MLLISSGALNAQRIVKFTYDDAGNRETRTIIELPQGLKSVQDTTVVNSEVIAKELDKIEQQFNFEKLADGQIKVFPNPVEGALMVRLENLSNIKGTSLQLFNSSGSLIQSKQLSTNYTEFNMQEYSPGIYILRILRQDEKLEYKIIKK